MKTNLLLLLLLIIISSCNPKNAQRASEDGCQTRGIVQDYSRLDGCGWIIVTESGEKLYVAKGLEGKVLKDKQLVKFNYKEVDDVATICMVESKIVELTCLEIVGLAKEDPLPRKCAPISSPMNSEWMKKLEKELSPVQIDRYEYKDGFGYHFICKRHEYFYDCDGNMVCEGCAEFTKNGDKDCAVIKNLKGKFTIWVVNQ